jgi:SAM-dependent methyltransferase
MTFKDHFSETAAGYASFRPHYPDRLFAFLAEKAPRRERAWDCATGSGQAAIGLAGRFKEVIATDASAEQIAHAAPHNGIMYRVAEAEASGLASESVDLVTVAQALHWFDLPAFFAEVKRVLVPGGLLAVWTYPDFRIAPEIDRIVRRYYSETVGPYWPPERSMVEEGYRSILLPFPEIEVPLFEIERAITLAGLAGYLRTWSATRRYLAERGHDPVADLLPPLAGLWGDPTVSREMRSPLRLRVARKESSR